MSDPICFLVQIYAWILLARVILSFVFMGRPDWVPPPGIRPLLDMVYGLTDPPVNYLRRFIPPLQAGAVAFDLAFLVWWLIIQFLIGPVLCSIL